MLLGNQHYHSMVYQILAYLSTALINAIWAEKKKGLKPSTESHLRWWGLEKLMSKHFKRHLFFYSESFVGQKHALQGFPDLQASSNCIAISKG